MKRWKHSGGNVINTGQVNLVSTCCRYQARRIKMIGYRNINTGKTLLLKAIID